jgi:hypothetical protein
MVLKTIGVLLSRKRPTDPNKKAGGLLIARFQMRNRFFGVLGRNLGMILFAVCNGFFQRFNAGLDMRFGFAARDAFGGLRMFKRVFGMFDQLLRMSGLAMSDRMFGMFQGFGGMFLGKNAGACK